MLPVAPAAVVSGCVWHTPPGQWRTLTVHCRLADGSVPSSASVALPENATTSPTRNVVPLAGRRSTGTGAWFNTAAAVVTCQMCDALSTLPAVSASPPAPPTIVIR